MTSMKINAGEDFGKVLADPDVIMG